MSQVQNLPSREYIEVEHEQSKLTHELMKQSWGANFLSPIEKELTRRKDFKVLDVGCGGSGSWLLQLSKDYPSAKFVGLDILPIFPKDFPQDNLQFIQGDVLEGLPFEDNSFDFVHMRLVLTEFTEEQWEESVINELVRVCKPGGWVELLEIEEVISPSPTYKRLISTFFNHLEYKGIVNHPPSMNDEIHETLDATNKFDTIYEDERLIPVGSWGGDIGNLALKTSINIFRVFDSIKWLRVNEEEYERTITKLQEEVEQYRAYIVARRLYCQKTI